jgi:hypothetical protein
MSWQNYEMVVKSVYETLGAQYGVTIVGYGHTCKRVGKSGAEHQIDVITSHSDGFHSYETCIECKDWNKKVTKDTVTKSAYIAKDCNFDKAIIVSKKGFTPDAIKVAKETNIHLVELAEHNVFVTGDTMTKFFVNLELEVPVLRSIIFNINESEKHQANDLAIDGLDYSKFMIVKPYVEYSLQDEITAFLKDGVFNIENDTSKTIDFITGTKINITGVSRPLLINNITVSGYACWQTRLDPDYFSNKIWFLMKLIFEKSNFIYTFDGQVRRPPTSDPIVLGVGQNAKIRMRPIGRQYKIQPPTALPPTQ